ncbi:hypothetical protein [Alteraurantiacibacter aquimixticola]|uniref:Uncharacterized protein n=1 Tax=Alteraurantiacibacter aquimixticola TaxID=2489173 RepID=A0A4T3EY95_9SPHN|nr:hypothetical protein [Alteraurantiacibacter aquimixticola]TIX49031.1 hypothetical protein E5222_14985 [Alteraurantiacibacter aquimixticola]
MIGKLIGAFAGAQASKHTRSIGGTGGAVLGALAVPIIGRMRLPALLALGAGAYAAKKLGEKGKKAAPAE